MSLVFDRAATNRFLSPDPDREEVSRFNTDPDGVTLTTITTDLDPISPQIILQTSCDITLGFGFKSEFAEAFGPGGYAAYVRGADAAPYFQRLESEKAKPFDPLGVIVQETDTPALNHTVYFPGDCRERWLSYYEAGKSKVIPLYYIEASRVRFANPVMTFHIRLAVKNASTGEVRYLRSSMRLMVEGS
jgi:hypothetical protein